MTGSAAAQISDADVTPAWQSYAAHVAQLPVVQPAAAPTAQPVTVSTPSHTVTVAPNTASPAPAQVSSIAPDGSLVTGYAPGFSPQDIVKTARETKQMQGWSNVGDVIKEFKSVAASNPGAKPSAVTTQNDIALANSLIRLQNPTGTGRGFGELKVTNLEEATPILEKLMNIKGIALKEHAFTPQTRARLITEGNRLVESVEGPARDQVALATKQLRGVGANPAQYLDAGELGLLSSGVAADGTRAPLGPPRTLSSGRQIQLWQ
jgi:hypothetical protein